jgi:hypothetical protein
MVKELDDESDSSSAFEWWSRCRPEPIYQDLIWVHSGNSTNESHFFYIIYFFILCAQGRM